MILPKAENLDLLWGARAIAAVLGKTERATFAMLERGQIPGVKKIGAQWVVSKKTLAEFFGVAA